MGEAEELRRAVGWLAANASFDVDARVHVFELTIRAVGGLLSAHMLIEQVCVCGVCTVLHYSLYAVCSVLPLDVMPTRRSTA